MVQQNWMKSPVSTIMATDLVTVHPDDSVVEAITAVLEAGVGALPVVDSEGILIGMVSKGALLDAWQAGDVEATTVGNVVVPIASVLTRDATVANAAAVMAIDGTHRVAVVRQDGKLEGLVSSLDVLAEVGRADGYLLPGVRRPLSAPSRG